MLFNDHHYFFQRSIAGSFPQTIDSTFYLPCAADDARNGICSSQP